jgi:hypothetical protein
VPTPCDADIRPEPGDFNDVLLFVIDLLKAEDAIDVHQESTPPWLHIVAADCGPILSELQRRGVRVDIRPT